VIADNRRIAPAAQLARVNGGNRGSTAASRRRRCPTDGAVVTVTGRAGQSTERKRERGCGSTGPPVRTPTHGTGGGVCAWRALRRGRVFFAEVEVGEVGLRSVGGESGGGLERLVDDEGVAVKGGEEGGEHGSEELPDGGA